MEDLRPRVEEKDVAGVVAECMGRPPVDVRRLSSGQISATFEVVLTDQALIVQFSQPDMALGLAVERLFAERLEVAGVPIRKVLGDGGYEGLRFTIARKAPGKELSALSPDEFEAALPSVFDTLLAVSSVGIEDSNGFGWFGANGQGMFQTWQDHLNQVRDEEPGKFYGNWHTLFDTTFLGRSLFDGYFSRMARLLEGISPPRHLVHGGFGGTNVLAENGKVTAVLDWQDARFGDPLFDLAYMDFWVWDLDLVKLFERHCSTRGINHEAYRERILTYKYYIGLDSMRFFAKTGNRDAYDWVLRILDELTA